MSVQRSPPCSGSQLIPPNTTVHYNSDPAINISNTIDQADNYFNITKRHKRTFDDLKDQPGHSSEIMNMLDQIKAQQEHKFESLNNTLITITNQNLEIRKSVESLTSKHEDLLIKINNLEKENSEYKMRVLNLEQKLDHLEKSTCASTIEIRNLPKLKDENKSVLINTIQTISSTLGLETPVQQSEIRDIFRTKSEAVVVDFTTALRKEALITKYKTFNKGRRANKEPMLNSEHIKLPGAPCSIFISEFLTTKAKRIFYVARENVKTKKLAAAWTSYGRVYIKTEEGLTPVRIEEESELYKLIM